MPCVARTDLDRHEAGACLEIYPVTYSVLPMSSRYLRAYASPIWAGGDTAMGHTLRAAIAAVVIFVGAQGTAFAAITDMEAPDGAIDMPAVRQAPFVTEIENVQAGDTDLSNTPRNNDDDHANE